MQSIKVLHTADTHFSNKAEKLAESTTTTNFILLEATKEQPDVAIIAGDLVDEYDAPIKIDSEAARATIHFVETLASICPVVIVRGTRSHDRETPYLFGKLKGKYAIHVASKIELVALLKDNTFATYNDELTCTDDEIRAVFTLIPSPDKCNIIAAMKGGESISTTTMSAKESLNDMLAYIGDINAAIPETTPRILVGHGMITGAQFSSGTITTGEDFEYCLSDLALTNTDLKAFGHIHKHQKFSGNIFYAGSPGRLNMAETEDKGFLIHSLNGRNLEESRFVITPAKRFVLYEVPWSQNNGIDDIYEQISLCENECQGADVRFRYTIPEEARHQINRKQLTSRLLTAGANIVKIEPTYLVDVRQRAPDISKKESLPEKGEMYFSTTNIDAPQRVYDILRTIEGRDVDELIVDAMRAIDVVLETKETEPGKTKVKSAIERQSVPATQQEEPNTTFVNGIVPQSNPALSADQLGLF